MQDQIIKIGNMQFHIRFYIPTKPLKSKYSKEDITIFITKKYSIDSV